MATHETPPRAGRITTPQVGRPRRYFAALEKIADGRLEQWKELARFESPRGALDALQRIRDGRRPIPRGNWEFRMEVFPDGDKRGGSRLLARFMGSRPDRISHYRHGQLVEDGCVRRGDELVGRL